MSKIAPEHQELEKTPEDKVYLDGKLITGPLTAEQLDRINPGFWLTWASIRRRIVHDLVRKTTEVG